MSFPSSESLGGLHGCHVTFRLLKLVCHVFCHLNFGLTLNSYLICLIYFIPCMPSTCSNLYILFYWNDRLSLSQCVLVITPPTFKAQLIATFSLMISWISSVRLNFFLFTLAVALILHHLHTTLLQVLCSGEVMSLINIVTIFFQTKYWDTRPNYFSPICEFLHISKIFHKFKFYFVTFLLSNSPKWGSQRWAELVINWLVAKLTDGLCPMGSRHKPSVSITAPEKVYTGNQAVMQALSAEPVIRAKIG